MPASYKTAQRPRGYRILPIVAGAEPSWLLAKGAIGSNCPLLKIPAVDSPQNAEALSQRQFYRLSIKLHRLVFCTAFYTGEVFSAHLR